MSANGAKNTYKLQLDILAKAKHFRKKPYKNSHMILRHHD